MAAVSRMSNPERVVITAVLAGVLRIDDQGRVWRNTKRGELFDLPDDLRIREVPHANS